MPEACPRRLRAECPLSDRACGVITHHLFYPRPAYIAHSETAAAFRELPFNKIPMCKHQESELHREQPDGPPMPTMEVMEHCVNLEAERRELAVRSLRRP